MNFLVFFLLTLLSFFAVSSSGATVEYNWDLTWLTANPDGRLVRPVIGVNGHWPPPPVHVTVGDRLLVHLNNHLGNESTTIHWHGIYQTGTTGQDGPSMVTQCPILPGMSYTYNFTVDCPESFLPPDGVLICG